MRFRVIFLCFFLSPEAKPGLLGGSGPREEEEEEEEGSEAAARPYHHLEQLFTQYLTYMLPRTREISFLSPGREYCFLVSCFSASPLPLFFFVPGALGALGQFSFFVLIE